MQGIGNSDQGLGKALLVLALTGALRVGVPAQQIEGLAPAAAAAKAHVSYVAEVQDLTAGKPAVVELRFRVENGFHVNSHKPKDELLIPTELKLDGAKVLGVEYPAGVPFKLGIGEGETLDVYQGEFRVKLRVVVPKGATTLTGGLRYQACDNAACYPPRTLGIAVVLTGK